MKKLIFITLLAILGFTAVMAQEDEKESKRFFIRGGITTSSYYGSGSEGSQIRLGYNMGFGIQLPLASDGFITHIQPSMLIVSKGSKAEENYIEETVEAGYLQVPVLLVHKFTELNGCGASIGIGPYLAYGLFGKSKAETSNMLLGSANVAIEFDTFGEELGLDELDFGLTLSGTLEFNRFFVGLDIDYGLKKIGDEQTVNGEVVEYPKNISGSLYLGVRF